MFLTLGVFVILYNTHPEIIFIHNVVKYIFDNCPGIIPNLEFGKLMCGIGAGLFVLNAILITVTSHDKLISLRFFLVAIFLLTAPIGVSLLLTIYKPEITMLSDIFNPIFPADKLLFAIIFSGVGGLTLVIFIITIIVSIARNRSSSYSSSLDSMYMRGFNYDEDGDVVTVTRNQKYYSGSKSDFQDVCEVFQRMFNNGYCCIAHVNLKPFKLIFKEEDNDDYVSNEPIIKMIESEDNYGNCYSTKEDVYKTRDCVREYVVTKSGTIKLEDGREVYRQAGDVVKYRGTEKYVAGQVDVWWQPVLYSLDYYFINNNKPVVAKDGTKLVFQEKRVKRINK